MRLTLLLVLILASSAYIFPATKTWDGGGGDANWQTAANWSTDVAPAAGDDLVFPTAAPQQSNNNNLLILTSFNSITVEGGAYTFGGNAFRLVNGLTVNGGTLTINVPVTLNGAQTFMAATGATVTVVLLSLGSTPFTIDGGGTVGIGLISGSGSVTKNGTGAGAIVTAAGFTGGLTLHDGIFVVDANIPNSPVDIQGAAPTGTLALSGFGGTGTVGATTVASGVISAGTLTSPTGILNVAGGLGFTTNGAYLCKIGGTTPGTGGHDQLNVTGGVNLSNSRLVPLPWNAFRPAVGDTFVIIKNDGTDAVIGTFLNAPEGAVFAGPLNTAFQISYHGGDGNDVTVKRVARAQFDFDADGKTDLSTYGPGSGTWNVLLSGGGASFSALFGLASDVIAPADFDGDNKTDMAVFRPSQGVWYILNSANSTFRIMQFGANGDKPVPNDFDGDGRADIAVWRPSDGVWYELRSLDGSFFAQRFGQAGDQPQMVDYDGDGMGDLSVYRPIDGTWHFWLSSTTSYTAFPFGTAGDVPVPGDYDGDGRTDAAVFRATADPNLPDFYILLSGPLSFQGASWGVVGDLPVVGDYDGDGKADIAVFRPSTSTWYLLRSTAGFSSSVFGASGSLPVPNAYGH